MRTLPMRLVSHRVQRLQDDKPVRVLFWAQAGFACLTSTTATSWMQQSNAPLLTATIWQDLILLPHAQDAAGQSHLAVIGTDPRGSGVCGYCRQCQYVDALLRQNDLSTVMRLDRIR